MDRQTLMRGAVVIVALIITGLAFVWSYVGALHEPTFHDVGLAIVGPPRLAERLDASSEFAATSVASRQAAIKRIDERKDFGAIVAGPRSTDVLVAPAAGRAVAIALRTNLPPALHAATATKTPVHVIDVKPLPKTDPSGITPFYLALGLVVANYIGAVFFAFVFGAKPVDRRVWWRILGVGIMALALALALGLGEVGIVNAIGPLHTTSRSC